MYVELRIRNGDAELVERLLYVLKHGEVDGPVILGFHPQTELDGDCGISMTGNEHFRCGILQHIVVAGSCGEEMLSLFFIRAMGARSRSVLYDMLKSKSIRRVDSVDRLLMLQPVS